MFAWSKYQECESLLTHWKVSPSYAQGSTPPIVKPKSGLVWYIDSIARKRCSVTLTLSFLCGAQFFHQSAFPWANRSPVSQEPVTKLDRFNSIDWCC